MRPEYTHEVQIEGDAGRSRWVPCVVTARRDCGGRPVVDVIDRDGRSWVTCHVDCVRPRRLTPSQAHRAAQQGW